MSVTYQKLKLVSAESVSFYSAIRLCYVRRTTLLVVRVQVGQGQGQDQSTVIYLQYWS